MNLPPTIALDKGDVSIFQHLDSAARPCLILYSGPDAGQRFDLDTGFLSVGRSPEVHVRIDTPGISRRHAELQVCGNTVVLRDLGSANGTLVNNSRITEPVALKDGDLVRLANVVLRFHGRQSLDVLLHDRIYRMAITDIGTGAFNRKYLQDALRQVVSAAVRLGRPLSVAVYDLDRFKIVNDTYGHAAGDQVLRECTTLVRNELRGSDTLCRMGGEEFAVLLPDTDAAQAHELAERLRTVVAEHRFMVSRADATPAIGIAHHQTISLGVAQWVNAMADGQDLLERADRRLYAAKHAGRNRVGD